MISVRAALSAAVVLTVLALGPVAIPLVGQPDHGTAVENPVDHRNDLPVVQPGRATSVSPAASRAPSRTVLLVTLVLGLTVGAVPVHRRRRGPFADPAHPPLWSRPPHRGPPLLPAG